MEQYIVSARKYRPTTFDSVVGQQALTTTLKNAISTGRLAHAYLFCGTRGVGKTSCARIFAKTINCTNRTASGDACNECDSCRMFNEGRSMNIVELDAASNNGVEAMRDLVDQVMTPPAVGKYRVFIIDEVHMLSSAAFNAFLKTLEEPPAYVVFILATTEKHKIIPTILSRCQIYDFNRISIADIVAHLQRVAADQGITADADALNVIARKADGGMRDALSIFDQIAASANGHITYAATIANLNVLDEAYYNRLLDAFVAQNIADALLIYRDIRRQGFDSQQFINGLADYLRDLAVAQDPSTLSLVEATDDVRQQLAERAQKLHPTFLYRAMDLCNSADFNFRQASNKQFLVELTLIKLCQLLSPSLADGADGGQLQSIDGSAPSTIAPQQVATAASPSAPQRRPTVTPSVQSHSIPQPAESLNTQRRKQGPMMPNMQGMSLGGMQATVNNKAAQASVTAGTVNAAPVAATPQEKRTAEFSEADVIRAWGGVADLVRNEKALSSALGLMAPELDGNKVLLHFPGKVIYDLAQTHMPAIKQHLADSLNNDVFELVGDVNTSQLPHELWPDEQVYAEMMKEFPNLQILMEEFGMRRL